MRNKENLKKFTHATKTREQKANYVDWVNGGTTTESDLNSDVFDETLNENKSSGNPQDIEAPKPPYVSWKTWFEQNGKNILIISIVIPVLAWVAYNFIDYGRDISTLNANYTNLKNDVTDLKNKYDGINEKSIKTEVLLGEIQKDIDSLNQKLKK